MTPEELPFDNWYDIFVEEMIKLGWRGNIDRDSAEMDYESGFSPETAAKNLYEYLTS